MLTALVTGGSRGIGAQTVRAFVQAGYRAAFFYHSSEAAALSLAQETGAIAIQCDVRDSASVRTACKQAQKQLSHIDVLVNNAGIAQQKLFTDISDEDWRAMIDTHLTGAFTVTREVLPGMISRRYGRIINVSSIWGQVGASCEVHYSAAKAGLIGMTKALSKEVAPSGVTVNCVCPGVIETDMLSSFTADDLAALAEETPVGRLGTPGDIARCILWLADEHSSFVTGQVIGVNGGFGE